MGTDERYVSGRGVPNMGVVKEAALRVFALPNQAYRVRSRFLSTRQGKNDLSDYVQELRILIAAMQSDPLPEVVYLTVFMEGLRAGISRTEVFEVHYLSFD